jgi:hypothetical protein
MRTAVRQQATTENATTMNRTLSTKESFFVIALTMTKYCSYCNERSGFVDTIQGENEFTNFDEHTQRPNTQEKKETFGIAMPKRLAD